MQANLVSCNANSPHTLLHRSTHSSKPLFTSKNLFLWGGAKKSSIVKFSSFRYRNSYRKSLFPLNCIEKQKVSVDTESTTKMGGGRDWTTSILLLAFYVALMYYVFQLSPNQTPTADVYYLKKLLNLIGDDGYRMNTVLVSLWYIMGVWPIIYSMLLLPTAKSTNSKIEVWPFCLLSVFGGAYALFPYFILWKPPPPAVDESELEKWPLNFLESKLAIGISFAAALGLLAYAAQAGGADWKEFLQYFRQSRLVHVTSIDFCLCSAFAPFWVYNDMTSRKWFEKGSWLFLVSVLPLVGPALYLILRPSLSQMLQSSEE